MPIILKKTYYLYAAVACSIIVAACASPARNKGENSPDVIMERMESTRRTKTVNDSLLMNAISSRNTPNQDYKIGPDDLIEISVFEEEKLSSKVRVSSQGNINFPLLGVLKIQGLTAQQLEREIGALLSEKYLNDPHVSVFITEYHNQQVSVIGAVEKPGVFNVTGQKSVLDLLAMAGGLKADATHLLFLIRPQPIQKEGVKNEQPPESPQQTLIIDLEELLLRGNMALNLAVNHGDIINIPISGSVFVGGEVKKPGAYPLKGKRMTVSQAITLAEGLKPEAAGSDVKIFRYSGNGNERQLIDSVDVYAIDKGKKEDVLLKENDFVIVPEAAIKGAFVGFTQFIKGLIGVGVSLY